MKFYTQFENPPKFTADMIDPDDINVESAGYIPPKEQIENMILAGKRLQEARDAEYYDYYEEEDTIESAEVNRFNTKSIDMAEVSQLSIAVEGRLKAQKRQIEEQKKEDEKLENIASQTAPKAPDGD